MARSELPAVVLSRQRDPDLSCESALYLRRDIADRGRDVRFVPIVLKKSFLTNDRKFLGPLMRFVRGDVRDHIVTPKIDHGSS